MSIAETQTVGASIVRSETLPGRGSILSVDALRGLVMILMALDHTRDFIHAAAMSSSPTDLTRTTAPIFFTRWITHICAPVFAFTAGTGAFLWASRKRTTSELSRFLVTRGLWLMLLEITVLRFILIFEVRFSNSVIILTVFWMLGLCMVCLAALVHLPTRLLLALSIAMIAAHNLLDPIAASSFGRAAWIWNILHQQGVFSFLNVNVLVAYPLVPWVGVMATGYCFGRVLQWEPPRRQRFMLRLGLIFSVAFVLLRALNQYGDPVHWTAQKSWFFTVLSFLNCTKYPPSLEFLLMALGPALVIMSWLDRRRLSATNPLIVFGRVPFFYFLGHLAVIHTVTILLNLARYGKTSFLLLPAPSLGGPRQMFPSDYGFNLGVVYIVWFAVVAMIYPVCRWYAGLKQRRHDWWLSYL